jgi:hypothetical protein
VSDTFAVVVPPIPDILAYWAAVAGPDLFEPSRYDLAVVEAWRVIALARRGSVRHVAFLARVAALVPPPDA